MPDRSFGFAMADRRRCRRTGPSTVQSAKTRRRRSQHLSYAAYQAIDANRTLSHIFAGAPLNSVNVVVEGQAEIAAAFVASGNYHQALGARTVLGRTINADDGRTGAPPLAVISYQYWRRRFVHDPQVIGKIITVE